MKKLSVITINFNNASGLDKTIKTVAGQSFTDMEYIVIDGASTDGSIEVIKKYAQQIAYWVSEKDNGIYHAMNKGISQAKGEYCLFLNSGDCFADNQVVKNVFSNGYTEEIIYGNMLIDRGKGKSKLGKMPAKISLYQMYTDTLWHPVSFIKKELFKRFGNYDENYKMVADYEFFFRTIIEGKISARHVPFTIAIFKLDGLSSNPENKLIEKTERERVLKKYLTETQLYLLEQQLKAANLKDSKLLNRIIKKLKQ